MYKEWGLSPGGKPFVPLLFAGDINVYSVARAFHEAYGIRSKVYGKYLTGPCVNSKIIDYTADPKADDPAAFLRLVQAFADRHSDKTVLLIGCGDSYVELASLHKGAFPANVISPYIDVELMHRLTHKEQFYAFCERSGVDYPDTFVHKKEMGMTFELPFDGPFIVKPSSGIEYWAHPFDTQKKVYKVDTPAQVRSVLSEVYGSGYGDSMIIQNFIPGDDTYMRVLTSYSDRSGKVVMMCLGHVLLEEHTPHGIGNHAVILTECDRDLTERYRILLEDLHYVGYSNFDIKYDRRDGRFKVFEINTRQGRSNYYVTGSGANVACYLVDDYLDHASAPFHCVDADSLWMVVPRKVAFDYVRQPEYRVRMRQLIRVGRWVNPLYYSVDNGLRKRIALAKNQLGHFIKFKKYLGKQ
ncbi:MAG: ATP-grasp domain-containing protein [Eubacteriales bacterium]|nr:ATP-grasp domain-containing protein [Eubacteriales bacterium]